MNGLIAMLGIGMGSALQAVGMLRQGAAGEAAGQYNAAAQRFSAQQSLDAGAMRWTQQDVASRLALDKARAQYGASGIMMEGSPMDAIFMGAMNQEMDKYTILMNAQRQAQSEI